MILVMITVLIMIRFIGDVINMHECEYRVKGGTVRVGLYESVCGGDAIVAKRWRIVNTSGGPADHINLLPL